MDIELTSLRNTLRAMRDNYNVGTLIERPVGWFKLWKCEKCGEELISRFAWEDLEQNRKDTYLMLLAYMKLHNDSHEL